MRAIPELSYCYYLANPHIAAQGPYDKKFLDRYVLPHVNTLVASGTPPAEDFVAWRREGRQWLANAGLPGISAATAPSVDEVYAAWGGNAGVTQQGYSGLIVDEFINAGAEHYRAWTGGMERLYGDSRFADRTFYAWCGELFRMPQGLEFGRALLGHKGRFVWEVYLGEDATEQAARRRIRRALQFPLTEWEEALPTTREHMVVCLGYMSAPPESLNVNPAVDYNVYMDMQMQLLATEPAFWKLYGVMQYSASYTDEEAVRWAYRMFRHYCIDGKRERLIQSPYELPYLRNPDFAKGTEGWRVERAEPGSVSIQRMEGLSWLQGRYPKTSQGDQYLRFKRCANGPNRVTQTIRGLTAGGVYSLKLLSADMKQLDVKSVLGVRLQIDGADVNKDLSFQYPYPSNYAHELGPYNKDHPAWINYHRVVFSAHGETAELSISDWAADGTPGGPEGQEIGVNFVEVQPYLLP
ncbi:MAG: hypothetical protein HZB26_21380 [Candidatus Hydrogenedentes bacterium]|nr:hypothetical protein [Candidatus Hydrogenedentota bacterium]